MKLAFFSGLVALVVGVFTSAIPGPDNAALEFCNKCRALYHTCLEAHCRPGMDSQCLQNCKAEICINGGADGKDCASKCGYATEECGSQSIKSKTVGVTATST
ncbi:hypothetical protein FKW77_001621 [Venturia effusa]|uniref:Extracellular membrane protein CFEM domain-containing protein n=1 Tax=Venturia effusa TaxID=50376 RepID=A0A517LNE2_9PEZI|nr:hypothetical protein FKW77_001621 [Venturia effusa]